MMSSAAVPDCSACDSDVVDTRLTGAHRLQVAVFTIEKMDCPTEEALLRKALANLPGVRSLQFDLIARTLRVEHDLPDPAPITAAIAPLGLGAVLQSPAGVPAAARARAVVGPSIPRRQWALMGVAGVAAIGSEAVYWLQGSHTTLWVVLLALAAIALGGLRTLHKGWIAIRSRSLNMNALMTIAAVGAVFIGHLPEAAVVIWLFGLAEMIEALSLDRARNAIRSLLSLAPEIATVRQADGTWSEMRAEQVALGAVVRVKPGERVPLDGVVTHGESAVNQAPITGESMPVAKAAGDAVFAGSINERGMFEFRVTAAKGETMLDRIARSVQDAQAQRAPTQRFVDRFAGVYTPVVVMIAVLVALVPPLAFAQPWYDWIYKALVLLVIACPCALVISTPVTVVSGLAAAARRGILVKGGLYLEQGRRLKTVALDKTGTLTHGKPRLTDVQPLGGATREQVLRIAASLEALSEHPVASAIVAAYVGAHATVRRFEAIPGRGAKGEIDGRTYYVGNHRLARERGVSSTEVEALCAALEAQARTTVVVMDESRALAVLAVADAVRETSREAVAELVRIGVTSVMLTGDNDSTARAIARQVGVQQVHSNLLPVDKLQAVSALLAQGPAGMVGDGVNDAPALARATIGFAMGAAGTDTAIETADVALMQDDLRKLPEFIRLSRRTAAVLWQNIAFAIAVKAVFFALTFAGFTSLWLAVLADMGASLIVVFNGLRLMRG